jgi:hypothetical protein
MNTAPTMQLKPRKHKRVVLPLPCPPEVAPPIPPTITPDTLKDVATYVFGPVDWKSPLARALGVNYRTVHRWSRGECAMDRAHIVSLWLLAGYHPLQVLGGELPMVPVLPRRITQPLGRPPRERVRARIDPRPVEKYMLP